MATNYGFEPTLDGLNNIDADSSTTTNIICDTIQINSSGTAPTVSALSNNTNIATTAWVTSHAIGSYVTLAGTQTITGQKTFSNANTYISGNLVTNSIQSSVVTSDINIGTLLTTGDINFATGGISTNVALNWGSTSNSGNLLFRGGSFTFTGTGITTLSCGAAYAMDIATGQTSGLLSIGTAAGRNAAINIGTGSILGTVITIGSTGGGTTTLNCGTLNLSGTANSRLGANMTSGTITIGGGSLSATAINIGSTQTDVTSTINIATVVTGNAPVNIGSVNSSTQKLTFHSQDFNINTGFLPLNNVGSLTIGGADINLNSTDTTCNGNFNASNIIGLSGLTFALSTTGTDDINITSGGDTIVYSPNLIMSTNTALTFAGTTSGTGIQYTNPLANEFQIQLLNVADSLYYVDNTGVSIFYVRANEFNVDVPARFTDTATFDGVASFTGDVTILQDTYPPSSTSAIGYNDSATTLTDPMNNTLTARSNFTLPAKGVWLVICGYEWNTNTSNTVESKLLVLSTTSAGTTPAAYGLDYYEEINDAAGAAGNRQKGTLSGVINATASLIIYVNARSSVSSGTNTELRTNVSWTRLG
jgi:hypothetical protein